MPLLLSSLGQGVTNVSLPCLRTLRKLSWEGNIGNMEPGTRLHDAPFSVSVAVFAHLRIIFDTCICSFSFNFLIVPRGGWVLFSVNT